MEFLKNLARLLVLFIGDIYSLVRGQERCDIYDMLQIISFGLLINALYGVMKSFNLGDLYIVIVTSYAIMRLRKDIKEHKC